MIYRDAVPFMIKLVGEFKQIFNGFELARSFQGNECSITMTKKQIAALLSGLPDIF